MKVVWSHETEIHVPAAVAALTFQVEILPDGRCRNLIITVVYIVTIGKTERDLSQDPVR